MSSSEQAPEPTMDEILASIRKIISDDEPGDSPQTQTAAPETPAPAEGGLADELANALNDPQVEAEAGDDILDLTQVVSEQAQSDAPQGDAPQVETPQVDALQAALGEAMGAPDSSMPEAQEAVGEPQAVPAPVPNEAPASDQAGGEIDISTVLAEAGIEETVSAVPADPAPVVTAPEEDLSAVLGQNDAPPVPEPVSAEAATITEALSAIDPLASEPVPAAVPDAEMAETPAVPIDEPAADIPAEASIDKGIYNPEAEEAAASVSPAAPDDAGAGNSADDPAAEPGGMPAELATVAAAPVEEPAPVSDAGEARTLEDSVKQMLRPMLREWLDENMERIVQKEVAAENLKSSDG